MQRRSPMFVEGFTKQIPVLHAAGGFLHRQAGPGSISEALAMKLPVIVERNAWTLPQERYNAEWIVEPAGGNRAAQFSRHRRRCGRAAAAGELRPLPRRRGIAAITSAVFEIPGILEKILEYGMKTLAHRRL